jgi:ABC-type lipoprotein export system ATPase subunit
MAGVLLERAAERSALASAVERLATGHRGELMMVLGEAGIGKTALLAVADELARAAGIQEGARAKHSSASGRTH